MSFKNRIKELRTEKGWNQVELARQLGVSKSVIGRYETGDAHPSTENLISIARIFNVSLDYLVGLTNEKGVLDEVEIQRDPELKDLINRGRPNINGRPVTDEEWKVINVFLDGAIHLINAKKEG